MRTDTIFYKLFQTFDTLLFELLNQPVEAGYRFISVEVKEKAFRFDGIFAPDSTQANFDKPIYFIEVQFQKNSYFYWEFLTEILLYLNQYKPQNDWKAVALFADRAIAPQKLTIFQQELIANNRLIPIYLNELQNPDSAAIAIIQLITCPDKDALQIIENLKQQKLDADIIKLVETVLLAKFKDLSREEIEAMFLLSDLKDTRVYKDALQEGLEKGMQRGLKQGLQKGLRKGLQQGKKNVETIAMNLLKTGMDIQQVAAVTGLTIEQVSLLSK